MTTYHTPCRPFGIIDAHNRSAAATGGIRYASAAMGANYNGHHVVVEWNSFRGHYVAGYMWAGWHVIARGDFTACRKARSASIVAARSARASRSGCATATRRRQRHASVSPTWSPAP